MPITDAYQWNAHDHLEQTIERMTVEIVSIFAYDSDAMDIYLSNAFLSLDKAL